MTLVVITKSSTLKNEHEIIERMFRHGLKNLHIRKPDFSKEEMAEYIEGFSKEYRNRMIIHSHHSLALSMKLKGIHLTEKARENPYNLLLKLNIYKLFRPQLQISTSFHKLNDLTEEGQRYKYVIFSPVFKSISKEDYKPAYKLGTIFNVLNNNSNIKVIALGGIEADNISVCYENLFKGVALSGYVWDSENPVEQFDKAKEICDQYKNKL